MTGKVFGFPIVLIVLGVLTAALVDVPLTGMNAVTQSRLTKLEDKVNTVEVQNYMLLNPSPTATPSASPTPTVVRYYQPVPPVVSQGAK